MLNVCELSSELDALQFGQSTPAKQDVIQPFCDHCVLLTCMNDAHVFAMPKKR